MTTNDRSRFDTLHEVTTLGSFRVDVLIREGECRACGAKMAPLDTVYGKGLFRRSRSESPAVIMICGACFPAHHETMRAWARAEIEREKFRSAGYLVLDDDQDR